MAQVSLSIHGRPYGVSCDDGQEDRVVEVAQYVDQRARGISAAGAASNENHLLVLTSLVLADEVKDLQEQIDELRKMRPSERAAAVQSTDDTQVMKVIEGLQERLNTVSERLVKL